MKDKGMKWVIVADVMALIVVGLLVWASKIEKDIKQQELLAQAEEQLGHNKAKSYDFDLALAPQNCKGVSGTVDAVLITDANYMDFTRVAIQSAKETKCPESRYNFYIMTMDLSDTDVQALQALAGDNVAVTVLPQKEIDLFYIRDTHVSKTSLLKYYIAEALPQLDKVLYMDSDVLVLHDLNGLFQTDIEGKYLAAVKDPSWFFENMHVVELNLEERGFYFNSGVMLMNLKSYAKRLAGLKRRRLKIILRKVLNSDLNLLLNALNEWDKKARRGNLPAPRIFQLSINGCSTCSTALNPLRFAISSFIFSATFSSEISSPYGTITSK